MAKLKKLVYSIAVFAIVLGSVFAFSGTKALAAPAYDYQLISQSAYPATLAPGATTNVFIEVKNTGTATWQSNVRLGSGSAYGAANQQRDYSSEFANSDWLSANRPAGMSNGGAVSNILPGWVVRFQFNIKAPMTNGTYKAYFTPVADGVTWMKDIGIYWQITVAGGNNNPNNPPVITPGAPLSVALSSDSPISASIPKGARGVTMAKFAFTGGSSASTISNLIVKKVGAGLSTDFDNVYLYDGDLRLTTGRSVNSSTGEVTFTGLSVSVPSNGVKVLSVVADIAAGANGNSDAFEIENASKIIGATFTGNFPVAGNTMSITNAGVGTITVAKSGSIADPKIGDQAVKIAEFKVTAGTEDTTLRRIALTNGGSISSTNITALSLKQNGTEVATSTGFVKDIATFALTNPMVIANGSDKIFQVFANVTGRPGDTIKIYVDNDADVYATGNTYGYGEGIIRTTYDGGAGDMSSSTLQGGTITVTSSGPNAADIAVNQNDVAFMNFAITSGVNAEVRNLVIKVVGNDLVNANTVAYYKDVKVKEGDVTILGPKELALVGGTFDTSQTLTFTDRFTVNAGQTRNLTITMDTANDSANMNNDTVHVELVAFTGTDIKSIDTNDYVTDIVPSTDTIGKTMTITTSALDMSRAATPGSQTVVSNKQNVDTVGFLFTASSASAATITSVKFTGLVNGGGGTVRDRVSSVSLYNATTGLVVGLPKSLAADDTVVFTGLSIPVPASGTVKLVPRVNIASGAAVGEIYFNIDTVATDVTSQDGSGNDIGETTTSDNGGPSIVVDITGVGTLNAQVSAATPITTISQAGDTNVEFTRVKYYAINEAFTLNDIKVMVEDSSDTPTAAMDVDFNSVTLTSGSVTVTGYLSGGSLKFTNLGINVPKDGNTEVILKASMNSISGGAKSGDAPKLVIDEGGAGDFKATGVDSGQPLTAVTNAGSITDLPGNIMVVRKTKPVISTTSASGTMAGSVDLYRTTIAAGSGDDASFKQLTLNISLSGVGNKVSSIAVYKDGVKVTDAFYTLTDNDGTITPSDSNLGNNQIETGDTFLIISWLTNRELVVAQGTPSIITVKGTAVNSNNGTFTASLADENTITPETDIVDVSGDIGGDVLAIGAGGNDARSIIWSDNSSASHDAGVPSVSTDWSNGYPLKDLPGATFAYSITGF